MHVTRRYPLVGTGQCFGGPSYFSPNVVDTHGFEGEQLHMFHRHILEHGPGMMLNVKVV